MAEQSPSLTLLFVLAVVVLIVGAVGGGILYEVNHSSPSAGPERIAVGDNVTVNYIGRFGSGPEEGRVFDTSLASVATANDSYPKSLQFSFRGPGQYSPLGVYVGANAPSGGYTIGNVTFGSVVTGFWQGLLGLQVNQSRSVTIPPELGYGPLNPSCLVTAPLTFTVPVLASVPTSSFSSVYPGVSATQGTEFTDPTYRWTDLVFSVNSSAVVVENLPTVGSKSSPSGWTVTVTNISSPSNLSRAVITLVNGLAPADAGLVGGNATSKVCSSSEYIVSSVDPTNGTYTENFNKEVVGETLIFLVTPVRIY